MDFESKLKKFDEDLEKILKGQDSLNKGVDEATRSANEAKNTSVATQENLNETNKVVTEISGRVKALEDNIGGRVKTLEDKYGDFDKRFADLKTVHSQPQPVQQYQQPMMAPPYPYPPMQSVDGGAIVDAMMNMSHKDMFELYQRREAVKEASSALTETVRRVGLGNTEINLKF
mgnify:CR=1 FL=1